MALHPELKLLVSHQTGYSHEPEQDGSQFQCPASAAHRTLAGNVVRIGLLLVLAWVVCDGPSTPITSMFYVAPTTSTVVPPGRASSKHMSKSPFKPTYKLQQMEHTLTQAPIRPPNVSPSGNGNHIQARSVVSDPLPFRQAMHSEHATPTGTGFWASGRRFLNKVMQRTRVILGDFGEHLRPFFMPFLTILSSWLSWHVLPQKVGVESIFRVALMSIHGRKVDESATNDEGLDPEEASEGADPEGDSEVGAEEESASPQTFLSKLLNFMIQQAMPLGLLTGVIFGACIPGPGIALAQYGIGKIATSGIFLISGLKLELGSAFKEVFKARKAFIFGVVTILMVTPLLVPLALGLPLPGPIELRRGLAIMCLVPTTLSSCVALTGLAGGSRALALSVVVFTNLLGTITVPLWLSRYFGGAQGVTMDPIPLMLQLFQTVLIPLCVGVLIREIIPGAKAWLEEKKQEMSLLSTGLLVCVPWTQVSIASASGALSVLGTQAIVATALGAVMMHAIMFAIAFVGFCVFEVGGGHDVNVTPAAESRIFSAIMFVSSQKTLPVALAAIASLNGQLGVTAMLSLPCILWHLLQIVVDSFVATAWGTRQNILDTGEMNGWLNKINRLGHGVRTPKWHQKPPPEAEAERLPPPL